MRWNSAPVRILEEPAVAQENNCGAQLMPSVFKKNTPHERKNAISDFIVTTCLMEGLQETTGTENIIYV